MKNDHGSLRFCLDLLEMLINVPWQTANTPEEFAAWSNFYEEYHRLLVSVIENIRSGLEK